MSSSDQFPHVVKLKCHPAGLFAHPLIAHLPTHPIALGRRGVVGRHRSS